MPGPDTESTQTPGAPGQERNWGAVTLIYILYGIGFATAVTALVGMILAYLKLEDADAVTASHFRYQLRTFWYGLIMVAVGSSLAVILIGIPILIWWMFWTVMRIVKGYLRANEQRPIDNPETWLF